MSIISSFHLRHDARFVPHIHENGHAWLTVTQDRNADIEEVAMWFKSPEQAEELSRAAADTAERMRASGAHS